MNAYTDTFKRKEIKYRLDARQHASMLAALEGRMEPDLFGVTRITSMYYDTPERALISRSLDKPLYKEKVRVRAYGRAAAGDRVFVELKKKFDGVVYKRRVAMSLAAARAFLAGVPYERACARFPLHDAQAAAECLAAHSIQVAREIEGACRRWAPLSPSMEIVCDRTAFAPCCDGAEGVRITFDAGIAYRDARMVLPARTHLGSDAGEPIGAGAFGMHPLLRPTEALMEVKVQGAMPLWLVKALDGAKAYPSSFSKYGAAYGCAMKEASCA